MYLYLYKMSHHAEAEEFFKAGVSNSPASRFKWGETKVIDSNMSLSDKVEKLIAGQQYVSDHPYQTEELHHVEFRYEGEAYLREKKLLEDLKTSQYWPKHKFSGWSECFRCDEATLNKVVRDMDATAAEAKCNEISELRYRLASIDVRATDKIERHIAILDKARRHK